MSDSEVKRATRVAEQIREELTTLLLRGEIHDPGVNGAIVSSVALSDDLRHAKIYVRLLVAAEKESDRKRLVDALTRAGGFIRRELGMRLKMRHVPEVRFYWDEGVDHAMRMDEVFEEMRRERGGSGEGGT